MVNQLVVAVIVLNMECVYFIEFSHYLFFFLLHQVLDGQSIRPATADDVASFDDHENELYQSLYQIAMSNRHSLVILQLAYHTLKRTARLEVMNELLSILHSTLHPSECFTHHRATPSSTSEVRSSTAQPVPPPPPPTDLAISTEQHPAATQAMYDMHQPLTESHGLGTECADSHQPTSEIVVSDVMDKSGNQGMTNGEDRFVEQVGGNADIPIGTSNNNSRRSSDKASQQQQEQQSLYPHSVVVSDDRDLVTEQQTTERIAGVRGENEDQCQLPDTPHGAAKTQSNFPPVIRQTFEFPRPGVLTTAWFSPSTSSVVIPSTTLYQPESVKTCGINGNVTDKVTDQRNVQNNAPPSSSPFDKEDNSQLLHYYEMLGE